MIDFDKTIFAPATPIGGGALIIIRISGKDCFSIIEKIFVSKQYKSISKTSTFFGKIFNDNELIDEVILTLFKAPHSYTGEDIAEISCHGSPYIAKQIMNLLIKHGAKLAMPGEFTQRAFLNAKMDLAQAEAVADLIASETAVAHKVALNQMRGGFSYDLKNLRQQLLHFVSLIELELDFSEEDVEFANRDELSKLIADIKSKITTLVNSFELGNALKKGLPVAIVGEPNVGKSTLLNTLLNEDKALVSNIPGTTRDLIEDTIIIDGILFRFIDTAGIRNTVDEIEQMGIQRTMDKLNKSDIVLLLLDAEKSNFDEKISEIKPLLKNQKLIVLINKMDIASEKKDLPDDITYLEISAKHGTNINELRRLLVDTVNVTKDSLNGTIVTNIRHYQELTEALDACNVVEQGLQNGIPSDFLTQDIKLVMTHIGNITGSFSNDEVLGNIFKNFCIGK